MQFSSIEFAIFLPVVFLLYWFVVSKNLKMQNWLLLIASYFFYASWDWRYLLLLIFLSLANYFIGLGIGNYKSERKRKILFIAGVLINLGILGVFKYYNFFIYSFIDLISFFGYDLPGSTTSIILPLGISFYVFLSLSYIIDIYKRNLNANKNIMEVLLTLGFFPILLAGPIQRPSSLLSQITKRREFDDNQAADGLRQILWGLFAKVVIADGLVTYVNNIFSGYSEYSGSTLLIGALFFTIQIYADFSGYSNMAIGIAKLFGFSLMKNFAYPYFSRNISEYWKRWHISLTTWFRDYIFLPMSFFISSGIKNEKIFLIRTDQFIYIIASTVTWFLTGLWHGPSYTFIAWGLINGIFLIIFHLLIKPRKKLLKKLKINNDNPVIVFFETIITVIFVILAWVFFKSNSLYEAYLYIHGIFSNSLFSIPEIRPKTITILILIFFLIEWIGRKNQYPIANVGAKLKRPLRWAFYYGIISAIFLFGGKSQEFIYFQF
jgi:alginate O-acetyltransferase complex protein AlgI